MSDQTSDFKIPTNEEVIEEITRDFKDQELKEEPTIQEKEPSEPDTPLKDNIPEDFDKSDSDDESKPKQNLLDDFIDEEQLKELNATLSEDQKAERKNQASELKSLGNTSHKEGNYLKAVENYTEALKLCPVENQNDRAVLYCNRAASKIQLNNFKETAIDDCTKAVELNSNYVRAYLRRAKLYEETDKLDESLEDYKKLLELDPGNPDALKATVRLAPLINERNEKLKTEMMGKLKDIGNLFLRPFGLSTENFQLQQDPNSGGYSINFKQNQ